MQALPQPSQTHSCSRQLLDHDLFEIECLPCVLTQEKAVQYASLPERLHIHRAHHYAGFF